MILTEIDANYEADAFFPSFDTNDFDRTVWDTMVEKDTSYQWVRYDRKKVLD